MKKNGQPLNLKEYLDEQGYKGANKALSESPKNIIQQIKDANLLGRGGAGFSTGIKMTAIKENSYSSYLIVNADEMEPGTFKDRMLLENNPHQIIEGMIIACHAIGSNTAYIFLRGEYVEAKKILNKALDESYKAGFLGKNLNIYLHISAGRYICGEETALINALEGKRAIPRSKPPLPQISGLFGKPTLVQNVETICNLPHISLHGSEWYKSLGKAIDSGTKIYGISGKINSPKAIELAMGTTAREIIFEHGEGLKNNLKFRAFMPGGASTDFLDENFLDVPMDYTSMSKMKTRMGTGTIILVDNETCPVALIGNLLNFFKRESCGFCTPCREGLSWIHEILVAIENGDGQQEDIEILKTHARMLGPGSTFCALAPGAASPLLSGLNLFIDDFLQHITEKKCPYSSTN